MIGKDENEHRLLRLVLLKTFSGDTPLRMAVTSFPSEPDTVKAHRAMIDNINAALQGGSLTIETKNKNELAPFNPLAKE